MNDETHDHRRRPAAAREAARHEPAVEAPRARRAPVTFSEHGRQRVDEYHWLNRRDDAEVLAFLAANNAHVEAVMRRAGPLRERLVAEMAALTPPEEGPAAQRVDDCWYRTVYEHGSDYPLYVRSRGSATAPAEVLLDANALAAGHAFFALEGLQPSPDHRLLAFAVDTVGRRLFTLRFKDLAGGALLPDELPGVDCQFAWAADSRAVFYAAVDPDSLRPHEVRRHLLGTAVEADAVVYREDDPAFRCLLSAARSRRFVFITCFSGEADEVLVVDSAGPAGRPVRFLARQAGHEYELDHAGDAFLVRTNLEAPDFRVCEVPAPGVPPGAWRELVPHRPGVLIEKALGFRDHLAVAERRAGLVHVRVVDRRSGEAHEVSFDEPAYHAWLEPNPETDTPLLRVGYTSLATPVSYYDYDMAARRLSLVAREQVPGYDPSAYVTERLWATTRDGARVPISLVARRDVRERGRAPLLLFGYGAYGTNIPTYFDQSRLVLLDRGFVYAMAHVRGGSELGRGWYESGRLLDKHNTFTDFIACAEHLVGAGIADPGNLFAESLSAGGLLLGAVINLRPELFRGVVAMMPFVDLLNTMADPSIPLTASEYAEWGDPRSRDQWEYMRSYSPYDNVAPRPYPNVLAVGALHDSQVQYWEPAKWVARLRDHNTAGTDILLHTHLEAGHSGTSGRMRRLRDVALGYAFLLDLAGITG
jgi:oligopeptidase B